MEDTISRAEQGLSASWVDSRSAEVLLAALRRAAAGPLTMVLPNGRRVELAGRPGARPVRVDVYDWSVFRRVLMEGDIGAGETYAEGKWSTDDLVELCARLLTCDELWQSRAWLRPVVWLKNWVLWKLQRNTLSGSRRNIAFHYDLSNEFYSLFLDPTMTYSCADFSEDRTSLESAQRAKHEHICQKLSFAPGMHVLEIGSGWGSFALHAAERYGVRVTGITLSQRQLEWARRLAQEKGLAGQVEFQLCDYRQVHGEFDAVVSIEMFEAVGHEYYADFFSTVERSLRPGGGFFLQTITIPDQRYDRYRHEFDFIKKHIFPGGLLASLQRILTVVKQRTSLRLESMREIGPFYARTLKAWRERFLDHRSRVEALGFARDFLRLWEFYLASCEAAFAVRHIGDAQLLFRKPAVACSR